MKKIIVWLLMLSLGATTSSEIQTNDKSIMDESDYAYLSLTYTSLNSEATNFNEQRTTSFYLYDLKTNKLKEIYTYVGACEYPVGVVDYKNAKVYYSVWGDPSDASAGDKLQVYDIKTGKINDITNYHHVFNELDWYNNALYGIVGGKESNGVVQLAKIDPTTGEIQPIFSNNTDSVYLDFSIDHNTGEIITTWYSDFARRRMDVNQENGKITPCPFFISSVDTSDFSLQSVIYTFSDTPYSSLFDNYGADADSSEVWETANNLEVSNVSRLNDDILLFIGRESVLDQQAKLMMLNITDKTTSEIQIPGVATYYSFVVSPDQQTIFANLQLQDGTQGVFSYNIQTQELKKLFDINEVLKDFSGNKSVTPTTMQIIIQ
ncbi:hypothetical protein H8S45_12160 [Agathobaculum sp. NSJ-28]|uniref:DUF4374 domain-containing protein n=1 Tax=Agathobaculum faecis TaxID=2763013 RepID=A0A923LVM9_9FIRM|nr:MULTISPECIES: hypothetical protein [Agathobaculum]MBC5726206.1 hypothetical protein [Agathobaculum faecis]